MPKTRADVDLDKLGAEIAATVERARENDPKALRAQLHSLQYQLSAAQAAVQQSAEKDSEIVGLRERVAELEARQPEYPEEITAALTDAVRSLEKVLAALSTPSTAPRAAPSRPARLTNPPAARVAQPSRITPPAESGTVTFRAGAQRMLESLGRMAPLRLTKAQWGTVAKMKHTSGTFSTYLGELRRAGLIDESPIGFTLTDDGFDYLGGRPAPMTGEELQQHYLSILRSGAARMLQAVMDAYPHGLDREQLSEQVGIVATSGTFSTYLGELRRNGLVEQRGAELFASDILMHGASAQM